MINNFPGYLGYGSIIAIHADWPTYPTGIGWETALRNIGNFPYQTNFYFIDDIDKAILFANTVSEIKKHKLHMAIWHEDLIELQKNRYISGVKIISEYQWFLNRFNQTKKLFGKQLELDNKGNIIAYIKKEEDFIETIIPKPKRSDFGSEYSRFKDCVEIPKNKIYLTKKGYLKLEELNQNVEFSKSIEVIVKPFLYISKFDTAIREVSLLIESRIKNFHKTPKLFGRKLIDYHIQEIIKRNNSFESAAIKCYKTELKTAFAYVRNDYAHNFKNITIQNCKSILYRLNELNNELDEVLNVYFKE